jgi:tetratricopeptide (TPR) repeat protein
VVNLDSFTDIALLAVDSPISIDNYPELAKSLPAVGSSVTVIGYPLGMDPPSTITQGIVSNIVSDGGVTYIQFDAAVNEGNSGGPIFSENGDLLGIVVQKIKGLGIEGIAWAVGADTVRSVLPTLLMPATPTPTAEDRANFYRVQAEMEFADANYLRAIEYYSEAIRLSLESPVAEDYNNRGIAYRTVGQPDKAVYDFTAAITISGSKTEDSIECIYYNNRGRTYLDQKQWELAIPDFTEAIKAAPCREAYIYSNRGTASYNLGHYLDAIQDYSAAISRDPQNAIYYAYRGRSYYRTAQYQSAITDLSEAIRLDRNDVATYFWRGASYYYVQQYQAAILDFTEVILSEPDNCAVYGWRSSAYYHEGKISEANRDVSTSNNLGGCSYLYPY